MIYLLINGIMNNPGSAHEWTDRGVGWLVSRGILADKFEYFAAPGERWFFMRHKIADLQEVILKYRGNPLTLVGHSNGCHLIVQAVRQSIVEGLHLHLISPATEADWQKNGLAQSIDDRRVDRVTVYVSGKDKAMRWARASRFLFGWMGLGFGYMGLDGPKNVPASQWDKVVVHREPSFGHSDWFDNSHFDDTMQLVVGGTPK